MGNWIIFQIRNFWNFLNWKFLSGKQKSFWLVRKFFFFQQYSRKIKENYGVKYFIVFNQNLKKTLPWQWNIRNIHAILLTDSVLCRKFHTYTFYEITSSFGCLKYRFLLEKNIFRRAPVSTGLKYTYTVTRSRRKLVFN